MTILDNTRTPAYIGTSIEMRGEDCLVLEWRGAEEETEIETVDESVDETVDTVDYLGELNRRKLEVLKMRCGA